MSLSYSNNVEYDHLFKLLLIGNSGVGKSCMLMQYSENEFSTNFYNTIGVDFKIKSQEIDGKQIKLQIWDTAGQDRFRTITCSYYRGAHGIIIVYDVTDKESFENVKNWMVEIDKYAQENVNKILVGNKCDLSDKRAVSYEEGEELGYYQKTVKFNLATSFNMSFMEVSAKTAYNIQECFDDLAKGVMKRINVSAAKPFLAQNNGIKLGQKKKVQKKDTDDFNIDNCCK